MRILLAATLSLAVPAALPAQQPGSAPGPSATARQGSFAVTQVATIDAQALIRAWPASTPESRPPSQTATTRNQPLHTFIGLTGCKADAAGQCQVVANFLILDPAGKRYSDADGISLYRSAPPARGQVVLGSASLGLHVKPGEALGNYTVRVETIDKVAGISLRTEQLIAVGEVPKAGGWQAVPNPDKAAELKGPVQAMLAEISTTPQTVARIERADRQVVAGTRYRLRIHLTSGKAWQAVVWRKLDGTYQVSEVAQVAK